MNIFSEKTVAVLELKDKKDTAVFAIAHIWNTYMESFKYQKKMVAS